MHFAKGILYKGTVDMNASASHSNVIPKTKPTKLQKR
jgi:hypothetical protein